MAVVLGPSSACLTSQPKFEPGAPTQHCTSATIAGVEPQTYGASRSTLCTALGAGSKSPPGLVQEDPAKNVCSQVASPGVAAVPAPS